MVTRQGRPFLTKVQPAVWLIALCILQCLYAAVPQRAQGLQDSEDGGAITVSGQVVYRDRSPVTNAIVGIHIFSAFDGVLPEATHTDKNGMFSLTYPALGKGYLYASKPEEGYPNPTVALYDQRNAKSLRLIELVPRSVVRGIILELESPLPEARLQATDAVTGAPITDGRIVVHWNDNRKIVSSSSLGSSGTTELIIPQHLVDVEIHATGYKTWHWQTSAAQFDARTGSDSNAFMSVKLQRD